MVSSISCVRPTMGIRRSRDALLYSVLETYLRARDLPYPPMGAHQSWLKTSKISGLHRSPPSQTFCKTADLGITL
jgi:hypothetical protein